MAGEAAARPVLKNAHMAYMKKHLAIGIIVACASGFAFKVLVGDKRKQEYAEFYK